MTTDEALDKALAALEGADEIDCDMRDAIAAIKQVRARPATEESSVTELEATNRQVEILSDALAESRREVAGLKAVQEVSWGVDWGRAGDKSCAMIIKRLPDGKIEVVAVEYEP
jgi:phage FluMu gp28-like protein